MQIWVGLGNPGASYAGHRHNVGFMAVDAIAARHGFGPPRRGFQGWAQEGRIGPQRVLLLKPATFMNEVGRAAGEAMRFDPWAIEAGVAGVLRVLEALDMTDPVVGAPPVSGLVSRRTGWLRARRTGILHLDVALGQEVADGDRLGTLFDSFGKTLRAVYANRDGIVIGRTEAPLVNSGDAVVHIAS